MIGTMNGAWQQAMPKEQKAGKMKGILIMANKYNKTPNPPKSELEALYFNENKTQSEVATIYSVSQKIVFRWFKDLKIKSRIAAKRDQTGATNSSWKGNNATYAAFHYRVQSARGKADHCENCGRNDYGISYDWANQTGKYEDINDYMQMCRSCHFKIDGHRHNLPNRTREKNTNKRKVIDGK